VIKKRWLRVPSLLLASATELVSYLSLMGRAQGRELSEPPMVTGHWA
jgi:hypothetical protein